MYFFYFIVHFYFNVHFFNVIIKLIDRDHLYIMQPYFINVPYFNVVDKCTGVLYLNYKNNSQSKPK